MNFKKGGQNDQFIIANYANYVADLIEFVI